MCGLCNCDCIIVLFILNKLCLFHSSLDTKQGRQVVDGGQYEALLRERQERAFGTAPDWADLDNKDVISDDEDAIVVSTCIFIPCADFLQ